MASPSLSEGPGVSCMLIAALWCPQCIHSILEICYSFCSCHKHLFWDASCEAFRDTRERWSSEFPHYEGVHTFNKYQIH